jgi:hypothetical protein
MRAEAPLGHAERLLQRPSPPPFQYLASPRLTGHAGKLHGLQTQLERPLLHARRGLGIKPLFSVLLSLHLRTFCYWVCRTAAP